MLKKVSMRTSRLAQNLFFFAALIAGLAILGWVLNVEILKSLIPGQATTKFNTAL